MRTPVVTFETEAVEQVAKRLAGAAAILTAFAFQAECGNQLGGDGAAEALSRAAAMIEEAVQCLRPVASNLRAAP